MFRAQLVRWVKTGKSDQTLICSDEATFMRFISICYIPLHFVFSGEVRHVDLDLLVDPNYWLHFVCVLDELTLDGL